MNERGLLDLVIARLPGVSCREKILLCESFNSEEEFAQLTQSEVETLCGRELKSFWDIGIIRLLAARDAQRARLRGIGWASWLSPAYPPLLREIYDPPSLLFFRGALPDPETPLVAVVGTRRPSPQAAAQSYDIARDLGRRGISVVSGLALGVDAMAHCGNLEGGSPAFAVLGSGVDEVYPAGNRRLAARILESGGGILSEYPPGMGPRKWNFPARNRIISGLARGVVIVEAPESSGALITARFAAEQNRDLWVASSGAACPEYGENAPLYDRRGGARLVREGALVLNSGADILREWNWNTAAEDGGGSLETAQDAASLYSGGRAAAAALAKTLGIEL